MARCALREQLPRCELSVRRRDAPRSAHPAALPFRAPRPLCDLGAVWVVQHWMTLIIARRLTLLGMLIAAALPARAQESPDASVPVTLVQAVVEGADVVRTARQYLGVPYLLGGTTPAAFDCSGFVRYVFSQYGIELPRTAREQSAVGDAPFPGDLQAGDLLFFYGGRGAQHVALYVGGDSIIHAASRGGRVKFDRLTGSSVQPTWFHRRLIAVRRILPADGTVSLLTVAGATPLPPPPDDRTPTLEAIPTVLQRLFVPRPFMD